MCNIELLCCHVFAVCYNVFMAIFYNHSKNNNSNNARKGACFSVTMPFNVENRLKEIQKSMGLNSRSQTIVFLIHHYDKEKQAFDSINKLERIVNNMMTMSKNADLNIQQSLPYNKAN